MSVPSAWEGEHGSEATYPEFLSRMTLTFTVSPAAERKTPLMKFSSIQGSNSPILNRSTRCLSYLDARDSPQGCLGLLLAGGTGRGRNAHVASRGGAVGKGHLARSGTTVGRETVVLHGYLGLR